jgi:PP-loop superfamily ATP-utilizing enzyme
MKVDPASTSYEVKGLQTITVVSDRDTEKPTVKVVKNITADDELYFLVVKEPPIKEISSPDDIETVEKHKVASYENRFAVRQEVVEKAKKFWRNIK